MQNTNRATISAVADLAAAEVVLDNEYGDIDDPSGGNPGNHNYIEHGGLNL